MSLRCLRNVYGKGIMITSQFSSYGFTTYSIKGVKEACARFNSRENMSCEVPSILIIFGSSVDSQECMAINCINESIMEKFPYYYQPIVSFKLLPLLFLHNP